MAELRAELSRVIAADAARIYAVLADYRDGHTHILPSDVFNDLRVLEGGKGAGTMISVRVRMLGQVRGLRMKVAEPEPGRVLTETDIVSGMTTYFTVDPVADGARVTIATLWASQRGVAGLLEGWLVPGILRKIYARQLGLLAVYLKA